MKPYSLDFREKIAAAYDRGEGSQSELADRFDVSLSFIEKLLRRRRQTGSLEAKPHTGGYAPRLDAAGREALGRMLVENNDLTLDELREAVQQQLGVTLSSSHLCRIVQTLDLPMKKRRSTPRNATRSA
jgi:putative transposase